MREQGRSLLILGGGVMQIPAITAARALECSVHVADGDPNCPGRSQADCFHQVDLKDRDGLLRAAETIPGLAGVFTAGTDFSTSVAYVTEALGLPGIPYAAALNATEKSRMRTVLHRAGITVPRFMALSAPEEADRCARELRCPVVVKPVDNMGARGVVRVSKWPDLPEAVRAARELSRTGRVIVEEFIPGQEYSLDAIVAGGEIRVTGVAERHIFFPPCFVEMGHTIPAPLEEDAGVILERSFKDAIRALGITCGAAKGDLFLDCSGETPRVVVGEVAARLSGGYMSGWTYPFATGVPLTEIGLRVALGEHPPAELFAPSSQWVVAERALLSSPGTVADVHVPAKTEEMVEALFLRCRPGDRVRAPRNNVDKVANAIARGRTGEEAERRVLLALDRILIRLEPGDAETDRFLFTPSGAQQFARYRLPSDRARRALAAMPPVKGDPEKLGVCVSRGDVLPVLMPGTDSADVTIEAAYPVLPAWEVLSALEREGLIRIVREGRECDALGALFWHAFLAAGRQGVVYLMDSLREGVALEVALEEEVS